MKKRVLILLILMLLLFSCQQVELPEDKKEPLEDSGVKWAGIRVSSYGMEDSYGEDNFPSVTKMKTLAGSMESKYEGSTGALVWIVGTVSERDWSCSLEFETSKEIEKVRSLKWDKAEKYLSAFDRAGYSVWLQVEPGNADIVALATEVMTHYKDHPCVKGFGIDVEWYKPAGTGGYGTPLSDSEVDAVLAAVRDIDPNYTVFVKHWDEEWLPQAKEGLIFVNDSQGFRKPKMSVKEGLANMREEFSAWAEKYAPYPVMFQIGYDVDKTLWNSFSDPATDLGQFLADGCSFGNDIGIIWVDFTLKDVL